MAGEQEQNQNQNQNQNQEPPQGNQAEARNPDGSLKDQTSIQQSGQNQTNGEQSQNQNEGGKSFLNREAAKPEDTKKPEGEGSGDKKPEDSVPQGAPERYEDFKLPDGYQFDAEALKQVTGMFKELGLSQEGAQKLVDYYASNSMQAAEAPYKLWADTQKSWVTEIDNRFGSKAEGMRTDINKAIDTAISSPKLRTAFREALDLTGAGSNPDFFEALSIFAKPFLEGTPVPAGGQSKEANKAPNQQARPSIAEAMYPHLVNRGGQ